MGFEPITAPSNLSFRSNVVEVIRFVNRLEAYFVKRKKVFINFKHVKELDYDAVVLLLPILTRFKKEGIGFDGYLPVQPKIKKRLKDSGFFFSLFPPNETNEFKYGEENSICTVGKTNVAQEHTAKLLEHASLTIWNEHRRCPGVQGTLIELMQNTREHASLEKEGEQHWWLSINHDKTNNIVRFSFIDYGVGIFKSLDSKSNSSTSRFHGWRNKLSRGVLGTTDAELFKKILHGGLHATTSGEEHRGRGLPKLYRTLKRNQISNLFVITNTVYANVPSEDFRMLDENFSGTFIYFELNKYNHNLNLS